MNTVTLIGRIARDIDIKQTSTGSSITRFSVACDRRGEGTDFINCKAFGSTGENISRFFHKGQRIGITGHINTGSYERNGERVFTFDVVVDTFDFIEKKEKEPEREPEREPGEDWEESLPF